MYITSVILACTNLAIDLPSLSFSSPHPVADLHEIFECTHLKFILSGWSNQTNKQTYTHMCTVQIH